MKASIKQDTVSILMLTLHIEPFSSIPIAQYNKTCVHKRFQSMAEKPTENLLEANSDVTQMLDSSDQEFQQDKYVLGFMKKNSLWEQTENMHKEKEAKNREERNITKKDVCNGKGECFGLTHKNMAWARKGLSRVIYSCAS